MAETTGGELGPERPVLSEKTGPDSVVARYEWNTHFRTTTRSCTSTCIADARIALAQHWLDGGPLLLIEFVAHDLPAPDRVLLGRVTNSAARRMFTASPVLIGRLQRVDQMIEHQSHRPAIAQVLMLGDPNIEAR